MRWAWVSLILVALVGTVGFVSCAKRNPQTKLITGEQVASTLAVNLCDKFATCPTAASLKKEECLQQISSGLADRLKAKPDLKVDQSMMDVCIKSIAASGCEILTKENPPEGCSFLE